MKGTLKRVAKQALRTTYYSQSVHHFRPGERPFLVRMDVNNVCNQRCLKCFYTEYVKLGPASHTLSVADFCKIAEKLFDHTYYLQMPYGFEALLHPEFATLMEIVRSYDIPNVGLVTNGSLLEGEKAAAILETPSVTMLAISLDSLERSSYTRMRGRDHLARTLENIASFQEAKRRANLKRPHLKINTVVARSNLRQLPEMARWCIDFGADELELILAEPHEYSNDESVVHCPEEYNAVHDEIGRITAGSSVLLSLPPRIKPAEVTPETGRLQRRHCQDVERSEYDTSYSDITDPAKVYTFPEDVFCVCPWMTLIVDSWGNVFPCSHRTSFLPEIPVTGMTDLRDTPPHGNILRNSLYDTVNSMRAMQLRREMLAGRHGKVCPSCTSNTPSSDPMKRKHIRQLPEPNTEI